MKKLIIFALATSFLATAASAEKPSDIWFICKGLLNPQVCKIFR
jgi:hypothetical protein